MTESGLDRPGATATPTSSPTTRDDPIPLVRRFPALAAIPRARLGRFPTPVERLEGFLPRRHVRKSTQPDVSIGVVEVPKLADHGDTSSLLSLDEFTLEEIDHHVPLPWTHGVLPELDDGAAACGQRDGPCGQGSSGCGNNLRCIPTVHDRAASVCGGN